MFKKVILLSIILAFCISIYTIPVSASETESSNVVFTVLDLTAHTTETLEIPTTQNANTIRQVPELKGTATIPTPDPKIVIGEDTRVRVTNAWKDVRYCRIGRIEARYVQEDGFEFTSISTGWLFGENVIMTAAHGIYQTTFVNEDTTVRELDNPLPVEITFTPAENGADQAFDSVNITFANVPENYINNTDDTLSDYAILEVEDNIGLTYGYFGVRFQPESYRYDSAFIAGYPDDLSTNATEMYWAFGQISKDAGNMLTHSIDTESGDSGAPLYVYWDNVFGWSAIGIHNGSASLTSNQALRITSNIMDVVEFFRTNSTEE